MKKYLIIVLSTFCYTELLSQCVSSGNRNGSVFSSVGGSGTWVLTSDAATSNDFHSTYSFNCPAPVCSPPPPGMIPALEAKGFGFTIPATSTICGVVVQIEKSSTFSPMGMFIPPFIIGDNVLLLKNGTPVATKTGTGWNSSIDAYATYGNATDLWTTTWTAADINSANFGVRIQPFMPSLGMAGTLTAKVDHFRITVHYSDPLPIALLDFKGSQNGSTVQLQWMTSYEKNNKHFIIQRSGDGAEWTDIDTVKGCLDCVDGRKYQFIYYPVLSANYYRLAQTDLDNSISYSDVLFIAAEKEEEIYISHNVLENKIDVLFSKEQEFAEYSLINCTGTILHQQQQRSIKECTISTSDLQEGIYYLRIKTNSASKIYKIIKPIFN